MKTLVLLLSIDADCSGNYIQSTKYLISEILDQTEYDILITTNMVDSFEKSDRVFVREANLKNKDILVCRQFNYNLKHLCFENIPYTIYDCLIYLDSDVQLTGWKLNNMDAQLRQMLKEYDVIGERFECTMEDQIENYASGEKCLFQHKLKAYAGAISIPEHIISTARFPSEHALVFKSDSRVVNFAAYWNVLNSLFQDYGKEKPWGDGFEIGLSLAYAGYEKVVNLKMRNVLLFNGHKYWCSKSMAKKEGYCSSVPYKELIPWNA